MSDSLPDPEGWYGEPDEHDIPGNDPAQDDDAQDGDGQDAGQGDDDPVTAVRSFHPVNWSILTSSQAEAEWLELNAWVNWLRVTYGLPASVLPPFWHRHRELVSELSDLHIAWEGSRLPGQNANAGLAWHQEFALAQTRLRDWTAACGTRLDRDRPTRQTAWPGEPPAPPVEDIIITDRDKDFVEFVAADINARFDAELDHVEIIDAMQAALAAARERQQTEKAEAEARK